MYEILIDNKDVGAHLVKIVEELNGSEIAYVLLENNLENRTLVNQDRDASISYFGEEVFKGTLTGGRFGRGTIRGIIRNSVFYKLSQKTFTGSYSSTPANQILNDICTTAGVTAGNCPTTAVSVKFEKASCLTAAQYLAYALNKDFWTSDNTFNIGDKGSNKGSVPLLSPGRRTVDRGKIFNRIYYLGYDSDGNLIVGQADDTESQSVYGIREKTFFSRVAKDVSTLNNLAAKKLAELKVESIGSKVYVSVDDGASLHAGDYVTIDNEDMGLSGTYRIYRITKDLAKVTLELETLDKGPADYLKEKFKNLEELGIYPVVPADQIVVHSGTAFPSNPTTGMLFYRTDLNKLFRYDGTNWNLVVQANSGTAFPTEASAGELFYRTDENTLYRYDGSDWVAVHALSSHGTDFPTSPRVGDFFYKTSDGYLYRYDGTNWVKVMHQAYGSSFPASPEAGDTFYHSGYEQTFYYDGTNWIPLATIARQGDSFPANAVDGDIFYRTDEEKFYRYNGTSWVQIASPKLSGLSGDLDDISDGATYKRVKGVYVDSQSRPLVLDLVQIADDLITKDKIKDWYYSDSAPSGASAGDIWFNTTDGKLYRYDGTSWVRVDIDQLADMNGDLDDIPDGANYWRVAHSYVDGSGRPLVTDLVQLADDLITTAKIAPGVAAQPSEELSTTVETIYINDVTDNTSGSYTRQTSYSDDGSEKVYNWSYTPSGAEYESTYIKCKFYIHYHVHTDIPPSSPTPYSTYAYVRLLEDGVQKGEVSQVLSGDTTDTIPACTEGTLGPYEIEWSSTKTSATIKLQIRLDDGSYFEVRIEPTITIDHKHRYKKYGVVIPV